MGKTAGGIFKAGAGCAGCGGLGAFTTGIFAAPTALGIPLFHRKQGVFGFGAFTVPAGCWDKGGFKQAHDMCLVEAQLNCNYEEPCTQSQFNGCAESLPGKYACAEAVPATPTSVSGACNSGPVIQSVQSKIGTSVDGQWGPNSQAALTKSGYTFQQLAPGCTPPVPSSGGGGGYVAPVQPAQPYVPAVPAQPAVVQPAAPASSGVMGFLTSTVFYLPMYAWLGAGAVALVIGIKKYQSQGPAYGGGYETF